jgi:signal transduction histidine kinase
VRRRLFLQIYAGFLAIALVFTLVSFAFHALTERGRIPPPMVSASARRFAEALPGPDAPREVLESELRALAREYEVDATVWSASGEPLAAAGKPLSRHHWQPPGPAGAWIGRGTIAVALPDGRSLGVRAQFFRRGGWRPLLTLVLLNLVIAAVAYPVSRRMARRLERLRAGADELGSGDLSTRVRVEGRDEIADVARSFNRAAERIEELVDAQRRMLAGASHELRTPLTRLRMALELVARDQPELLAAAERDVAELDALIDDLLLAARLQSGRDSVRTEPVALLDLLTDEAGRVEAAVSGSPVTLRGDPKLLRRMLRNLLDNARRHGGGADIEASVAPLARGSGARVSVADRGPGVSESERDRIFEPFYRPEGHSESRDGGVGLGLALVREIARRHGGEVDCRARSGGGTLFEVELCDVDAEAE